MNVAAVPASHEANSPRAGPDKLHAIQALRGIAALLVVLYHGSLFFLDSYRALPLGGLFLFCFAGVHIFFVLSGFIICTVHHGDIGRPRTLWTYAKKRFMRIYPIYWITLALLSCWYLSAGAFTPRDVVENIALLRMPERFINPVCWTLSFEVLFYLLFGLLILNRGVGGIALALWVLGIGATALLDVRIPFFQTFVFFKYAALFLIGLAASMVYLHARTQPAAARHRLARSAGLAGLAVFALTAGYCVATRLIDWNTWALVLAFGLAAGMFMLATLSDRYEHFFRRRKLLAVLGDASYSIYLVHLPLLSQAVPYARAQVPGSDPWLIALLFGALCALTLLAGWLLHMGVERPLLRLAARDLARCETARRAIAPGAPAAASAAWRPVDRGWAPD